MKDDNQVKIILVKNDACPYCKLFAPIYEYTKDIHDDKHLENKYKLSFSTFDVSDSLQNMIFEKSHPDCYKLMDGRGVPSVFVNIIRNGESKYYSVDHTMADRIISNEKKRTEDASKRFMTNVKNKIKSIMSGGQTEYMQSGGINDEINNETELDYDVEYDLDAELDRKLFKQKYLKYKEKYLALKSKSKLNV